MNAGLFRYADGTLPNTLALVYAFGGYGFGFTLLLSGSGWLNAIGVLLLAHAMVIAAYLVHECTHHTIFRDPHYNRRLGQTLNWLTGACYGDYDTLRELHMRHHIDNADVLRFNLQALLSRYPWLCRICAGLEWLYIPALEIVMHVMVMLAPFTHPGYTREQRRRVIVALALRGMLLALLAWYSPMAVFLYALAYLLMLTVLRFYDAFQHNFEVYTSDQISSDQAPRRGDRDYEYGHTFSNLLSERYPWLNLLHLNFAYHNAHHARPTAPWHRLPALHKQLYGDNDGQVLSLRDQLRCYHRQRLARVCPVEDEATLDMAARARRGEMVGAYGVSFLTVV